MAELSPKQRRVLRSHLECVEYGEMGVHEWLEIGQISETAWRKPYSKGGNYFGTYADDPDSPFRRALAASIESYEELLTTREQREVRRAARIYRQHAAKAAQVHVDLMTHAEREDIRLRAASEVADRADASTAAKGGDVSVTISLEQWKQQQQQQAQEVSEALDLLDTETQPDHDTRGD